MAMALTCNITGCEFRRRRLEQLKGRLDCSFKLLVTRAVAWVMTCKIEDPDRKFGGTLMNTWKCEDKRPLKVPQKTISKSDCTSEGFTRHLEVIRSSLLSEVT
jgi:hypothetical protein